jgi:hypothetical protein
MIFASTPLLHIELACFVERNRITIKQIRHHDNIAIHRKLISNELGVDEPVADDVRESESYVLVRRKYEFEDQDFKLT